MDPLRKHYLAAVRKTARREKSNQRVYDRNYKCIGWVNPEGTFHTSNIDCPKFVVGLMVGMPREARNKELVAAIRQLRGVQKRAA